MPTDLIADPASWPVLAGAVVLVLVILVIAVRRATAWRKPVRVYDQEQRALANFRRRLSATSDRRDRRRPTRKP